MFKKICEICGEYFTTGNNNSRTCSLECAIKSRTTPAKPREIIIDDSYCRIWRDELDSSGEPIMTFGNQVKKVREVLMEDKGPFRMECGNRLCMNKKHIEKPRRF